jgi:ribonuclease HI
VTAIAYTDGSANNKTHGSGGYGIVVQYFEAGVFKQEVTAFGGRYNNTTSARMEIRAILELLRLLNVNNKELTHVTVYSDNEYCVNTISKAWLTKWCGDPNFHDKKNRDLWRQVYKELNEFTRTEPYNRSMRFEIKWVKGHNNTLENEMADILAKVGGSQPNSIVDNVYFAMKNKETT